MAFAFPLRESRWPCADAGARSGAADVARIHVRAKCAACMCWPGLVPPTHSREAITHHLLKHVLPHAEARGPLPRGAVGGGGCSGGSQTKGGGCPKGSGAGEAGQGAARSAQAQARGETGAHQGSPQLSDRDHSRCGRRRAERQAWHRPLCNRSVAFGSSSPEDARSSSMTASMSQSAHLLRATTTEAGFNAPGPQGTPDCSSV